jgi:glutathione S-transferase
MGGDETIATHTSVNNSICTFYATWFCPYAQRAWIALCAKGVSYKWVEAVLYEGDSSSKKSLTVAEKQRLTPGFVECSPRGLVPALLHGQAKVFDSIPLMEYIEEAFEGLSLLPREPETRAYIRAAILLWSELVIRRFYTLLMATTREGIEKGTVALIAGIEEMIPYFSPTGPFFSDHGFSLFECSALPWFQRIVVLKAYKSFSLPEREPFNRLSKWYAACLTVPSYANTIVDSERLIASYVGYAENTGTSNCSQLTKSTSQSEL